MSKKASSSRGRAKPAPVSSPIGYHNSKLYGPTADISRGDSYRRRHTVCITPSLGRIPVRVVAAMGTLMKPMNAKWHHHYIVNQEVGKAYEQAVDMIRGNPEISKWEYVLTWEEDNVPPPDGLIKLIEDMEANPKYDMIGGLYFTKGEGGKPMCYGKPDVLPKDFVPFLPMPNSVTECNGLGQGFTLYRMKFWLDSALERPLFLTEQTYTPGVGVRHYTQDLRMHEIAAKHGYRAACSSRVLVGHLDAETDTMW